MPELAFAVDFQHAWLAEIAQLDAEWQGGDAATEQAVTAALAFWRERLHKPAIESEEWFDVVDVEGNPLGWAAPRWFCHLTGLRHRVVYVFLSTTQGFLALQMRAHDKSEWPSLFDVAVGGHLKAGQDWSSGVVSEVEEEVGLKAEEIEKWLVGGELQRVGRPYCRYGVGTRKPPIRNRQVNQIFSGELTPWGLANIRFADGEVSGMYICAPTEVQRMIDADFLIAPGLRNAFAWWLEWWECQRG